eukprot:7120327-Prymnesium_polylepis.2
MSPRQDACRLVLLLRRARTELRGLSRATRGQVGDVHGKEENAAESSTGLTSKLDQALAGATVGAPSKNDYVVPDDTNAYFGSHREDLLKDLGVKPGEQINNYAPAQDDGSMFAVGSGANAAFLSKQIDMSGLPPAPNSLIPSPPGKDAKRSPAPGRPSRG